MTKIRVKFFARIREIAKTSETEVHVDGKAKLIDIMNQLANKYGAEFKDYVFKAGRIASHVILIINGNPVKNQDVYLEENDTLAILPPFVGGGSCVT